jgi:hypothetical protein
MKILIKEALSDIVYHFTSSDTLINILENNVLYLSPAFHSKVEQEYAKNKLYFLSTTRSRSEGFFKDIRITLDGRKLNQKYKGFPMDYWKGQEESPKSPLQKKYSPELEDRLLSNKPIIDNANRYILRIDVMIKKKASWIPYAYKLAKDLNIPIFFYDDESAYALSKTDKAIKISNDNVTFKKKNDVGEVGYYGKNILAIIFCDKADKLDELNINHEDKNEIKNIIKQINNKRWDYDVKYLSHDVKMLYNKKSKMSVDILTWLSNDMIKNKTTKFEDYINKKINS